MGPNRVRGADQRRSECDNCGKDAKSRASQPGILGEDPAHHSFSDGGFDAAKLHEQLAGLLQLYLARAADPDAVAQCSAKDAIACAKALTAMMSDLQSARPASVDKTTTWPCLKSSPVGRQLVCRRPETQDDTRRGTSPRPTACRPKTENEQPTTILDDALAAVLSTDQESHLEEPYMRFISRADRLCKEVRKRLDATQSSPNRVGGAHQRRSCRGNSRIALGENGGARRSRPTAPIPNPFPPLKTSPPGNSPRNLRCDNMSRSTPDNANGKKRRRRSLYTLGTSLWSNNQQLTTKNRVRAAAKAPT